MVGIVKELEENCGMQSFAIIKGNGFKKVTLMMIGSSTPVGLKIYFNQFQTITTESSVVVDFKRTK